MKSNNLRSINSYIIIIMILCFLLRLLVATNIRTTIATTYYDNKHTKIGIIGAAGFIGSAVGDYLSEVGFSVRGFDRNPLLKYQKFDIIIKTSDQIDTYEIALFDVIVYLGGSSNRERIEVMSNEYIFDENVNDILVLVRKMKPNQLLIFASTSGILQGSGKFPMKESEYIHISKLDAYCGSFFLREQMLMNFYNSSRDKPSMIGIRFSTVVGTSPRLRSDSFIHSAFKSAYSVGIIKLNNPDEYSAYLWKNDLVEAISKIIYKRKSLQNVFEIYNLQSVSASMFEVATAISLITNAQLEVIPSNTSSFFLGLSMDSSSFERVFAFKPKGTLELMLKDYNQNMMFESNTHPNISKTGFEVVNRSTPRSEFTFSSHSSRQEVQNGCSIVKYSNIDNAVVPNNFKEKLQFYVVTLGQKEDCGGCKVLLELISILNESGYKAVGTYISCPSYYEIEQLKIRNKTAVFLYPEIFGRGCYYESLNITHVHWILAPLLGPYSDSWGRHDLVFTYRPGIIHRPLSEISNTLMVMENPKPGDETDIPDSVFYNRKRSGILWIQRKAFMFHKNFEHIHNQPNLTATQNESLSVLDLRNYEYFISYDPYSYWSFLAAMSGAVSVVYPLHGVTKEQWTKSVFIYEYLQNTGKTFIPGVAYGWVKSELEFARETMHELRTFLIDSKKWGEQFTVDRFARDCYRHITGMRSNFEAAGLVRDFFP